MLDDQQFEKALSNNKSNNEFLNTVNDSVRYGALGGIEYGPRPDCIDRASEVHQVAAHEYYYIFDNPLDAKELADAMGTEVLPEDEIMQIVSGYKDKFMKYSDFDL